MKNLTNIALSLLLVGGLAGPAAAQDARAGVQSELREMAAAPSDADAHRAVVRDFIGNDRVRTVAADLGIDLAGLDERVATLSDGDAADLAKRIRDANEDPLAGGDTLVITSTTIIIVLLIILLVAVA